MTINGIEFSESNFKKTGRTDDYCFEGYIVSECGQYVVCATSVHGEVEIDAGSLEEV